MIPEPIRITLLITEALESLDVLYAVGGSLASAWHGFSRSTVDSDIVAALTAEKVTRFVDLVRNAFYVDEASIHEAVRSRGSFNVIHLDTMFKVDVFVAKQRPFDRNQLANRRLRVVGDKPGNSMYFASAEDTILAKLEWYRLGGEVSDRQWNDILGIGRIQGADLDWVYLRQQAAGLGVRDLLERFATEVEVRP